MVDVINWINNALYTYILIILLVAGGIYFTIRSKGAQFRLLGEQIKSVTEKPKDGSKVSSFQALMVSTASRVVIFSPSFAVRTIILEPLISR